MKQMIFVCLAVLLFVVPTSGYASDDVNSFWTSFRQAVIDHNVSVVAAKTRFPFEVRGVSDSDPVQHFNRGKFPTVLKQVVTQKIVVQSERGIEYQTMLDVIKKKKHIDAADLLAPVELSL